MEDTIPLNDIWQRLMRVTSLRFEAQSANSDSGWNGAGQGTVRVATCDSTSILFHESGSWTQREGREITFTNVFRWTRLPDDELLRLEHLRFGKENPVYLFDLKQADETTWESCEPHVCREDLYTAEMYINGEQLILKWVVIGPTKNESIRYSYS